MSSPKLPGFFCTDDMMSLVWYCMTLWYGTIVYQIKAQKRQAMSEDNNTNTNESNGSDIYNDSEDADDGEQDPALFQNICQQERNSQGEKKILGKPYESMVLNLILIAAANQIILTDAAGQHKRDAMAKVFEIVFDPINGIGS